MYIVIYTICKNEAKQVEEYLACCREADQVVVTDTGSTDGTPEKLRQGGAIVHSIHVSPWRFDLARNASLALLPAEAEVCIKLDLDERLLPGWRQYLEGVWTPETTRLRYPYTWNWLSPGVPDVQFHNDLIHARKGYRWHHPTHEVLTPTTPQVLRDCALEIHHFPEAKTRPDDIPLLELAVKEDKCPRTLFYLGREYYFRARWPECLATLQMYLDHPHSTWKPERAHALRLMGRCYERFAMPKEALAHFLRSVSEDPSLREGWVDLAQHSNAQQDWAGTYWACVQALKIETRPGHYQSFGYAWGSRAHDLAAVAAHYMGWREEAQAHMRAALEIDPDDERLKRNASFIL